MRKEAHFSTLLLLSVVYLNEDHEWDKKKVFLGLGYFRFYYNYSILYYFFKLIL